MSLLLLPLLSLPIFPENCAFCTCLANYHVRARSPFAGRCQLVLSTQLLLNFNNAQLQKSSDTVMYTISARTRDLSLAPVCLQVLLCTLKTPILIVQYTNRSLLTPANRHMSSPPPSPTTATGIIETLHHISQRILLVGGSSFWVTTLKVRGGALLSV